MFNKNKKAISEITSFVLITLIVVVSSTMAYLFSKNLIDENLAELDGKNMDIYLKKIYYETNEISSFDGSSISIPITFKTGQLVFVNNTVYYQTLNSYSGSDYCFDILCSQNKEGYERKYVNLTSPYQFSNNLTLSSGTYTLLFKHLKNESEIIVTFK